MTNYTALQNDQVVYNIYSCNANGTNCTKLGIGDAPGDGSNIFGGYNTTCSNPPSVSPILQNVCFSTTDCT